MGPSGFCLARASYRATAAVDNHTLARFHCNVIPSPPDSDALHRKSTGRGLSEIWHAGASGMACVRGMS
jgi:hypothetical protein